MPEILKQPFGVTWRKALVSIPRLVPDFVLHFTNADGPQPITFDIPSRDAHLIPIYVFLPPPKKQHHHHLHGHHHHRAAAGAHIKAALHVTPDDDDQLTRKLPVLIDFHGGSFILGSCQEQAPFCAQMCRELDAVVITVDYRLGPYAQYPAANLDAEDVVRAVLDPDTQAYNALRSGIAAHLEHENQAPIALDTTKLAFSGFSSGGNLALGLALSVTHDPTLGGGDGDDTDWPSPVPTSHPHPIPLLLFYPSLDCRLLPNERPRPEGLAAPSGFVERWRLESELMPTYLPAAMRAHPRASPGLADIANETGHGTLHPRAKILLVLPQLDSLASQSEIWVEKVKAQGRGGDLVVDNVLGVSHGWTQFPDGWISDEQRRLKREVFARARDFLDVWWDHHGGKDREERLQRVQTEAEEPSGEPFPVEEVMRAEAEADAEGGRVATGPAAALRGVERLS